MSRRMRCCRSRSRFRRRWSFEALLPPSFAESLPFTMGDEPL